MKQVAKAYVKVEVEGLDEASTKAKELVETLKKARTLAGELAKMLEDNLYFNVEDRTTGGTCD